MKMQSIETKIHESKGQKVMLDFDLAGLYETETKYLKRAVRLSNSFQHQRFSLE